MKSLIVIWVVAILVVVGAYAFISHATAPQTAFAQSIGDKYDGDCQPDTTVGRCADKCPNATDTLLGYDRATGAAICKRAPTGCPYADSVPLGAECDKLAPQQTPASITPEASASDTISNADTNGFIGK